MFHRLPASSETRDALHAFCRVLGSIRGQLSAPHPRSWHLSLQVDPTGFATGPIGGHDSGQELELQLDCDRLRAELVVDGTAHSTQSLRDGLSAAELGARWVAELGRLGVDGAEVDTAWRLDVLPMRREHSRALVGAFHSVGTVFAEFRKELAGEAGPIQLWPHHFDLSFEWFGRDLSAAEGEAGAAQIGFGFSTGDEGHPASYFYANPWPFDERLVAAELPTPAGWHTEGWSGSLLPYDAVREDPTLLLRYLEVVYLAASPGLA